MNDVICDADKDGIPGDIEDIGNEIGGYCNIILPVHEGVNIVMPGESKYEHDDDDLEEMADIVRRETEAMMNDE